MTLHVTAIHEYIGVPVIWINFEKSNNFKIKNEWFILEFVNMHYFLIGPCLSRILISNSSIIFELSNIV